MLTGAKLEFAAVSLRLMNRSKRVALASAAALLIAVVAFPSSALAQGAAGDQYTEQVPDADGSAGGSPPAIEEVPDAGESSGSGGGGSGPSSGGGGADGSGSGALSPSTINEFEQGGDEGSAAADLAQRTAPESKALDHAGRQAQAGGLDPGAASGAGVFDSVQDDGGSNGMGVALPILLAAALLAAGAYWFIRRRNQRTAPGGAGTSHA